MRRALVFVAVISVGGSVIGVDQSIRHLADDPAVLLAVIEHTIRPQVSRRRTSAEAAEPPVILWEASVPICSSPPVTPCVTSPSVSLQTRASVPDSTMLRWDPPVPIMSGEVHAQLVTSFRVRHEESHTLPPLPTAGLELAPRSALRRIDDASNNRQGRVKGYSAFSLPGYSGEGHALIYGSFMCGGRCGYMWLFVLQKQAEGWQVVSKRIVGMR